MTELRPRDFYDAGYRRWLKQSLRTTTVLLTGPVGSGAEDLAWAQIENAKTRALLRPRFGVTEEEMIASVVVQIVRGIRPTGHPIEGGSTAARRARVELARRYGHNASMALDIAEGTIPPVWSLAEAIGLNPNHESLPPVHISIANIHRMPEPLLWELRDLINVERAVLIATTHDEHLDATVGVKSALYGSTRVVDVHRIDPHICQNHLQRRISPSELDFLLLGARGRAATTLEVLSFWKSKESIQKAWSAAVASRKHEAESVLNLAAGVHAYAPRLLIALAHHQAPYGAIPTAPSQRVARALAKLRDMDLIEQPEQRRWWIADPLLQDALVSHVKGSSTGRLDLSA